MMTIPSYKRPWYLPNGHLETIWPSLFRKIPLPDYKREKIPTPDDDFLLLDWLQNNRKSLAVISHGLEGDSGRHYVVGMVHAMAGAGRDVLAWNFRGCGGEVNRQPRFTHNGATDDLDTVIRHALERFGYESIVLVGFSMGGNLSLVYLGRDAQRVPAEVKATVCLSVPCDLAAASARLAEPGNFIYMRRFMRMMGEKVRLQANNYPDLFPCDDYAQLKTFADFDGRYTAPLHGFRDAEHYWAESSSLRYLADIKVPAWIVNASNDPFLAPSCFPGSGAHGNPLVKLLNPEHGGHCGFAASDQAQPYWSEELSVRLLSAY